MKIQVLFFAGLKDIANKDRQTFEIAENTTVSELLMVLKAQYGPVWEKQPFKSVVNQEFSDADRQLKDGDIVGLLPPVSGG